MAIILILIFFISKRYCISLEIVISFCWDIHIETITIKYTVITFIIGIIFWSIFSSSSESFAQNTTTNSPLAVTKSGQIKSSCELTVPTIQGPFYKEDSPQKEEFAKGIEGEKIVITGKVINFYI